MYKATLTLAALTLVMLAFQNCGEGMSSDQVVFRGITQDSLGNELPNEVGDPVHEPTPQQPAHTPTRSEPAPSPQPTPTGETGTYIGYLMGNPPHMFIKTLGIPYSEALANCVLNARNNPSYHVRCTFDGAIIYDSRADG